MSEKQRHAASEAAKRAWADIDTRKSRSKAISEAQLARSDEMSRIAKVLWQDPEYRAKIQHTQSLIERWPGNKVLDSEKIAKNCEQCQQQMLLLPSRVNKRYCSIDCRIRARCGRPNYKNRGKIPSRRAGSGISGKYGNWTFRSIFELSFIINVVEREKLRVSYEPFVVQLENGTKYIPDFVSDTDKIVWEVKYAKALLQSKISTKLEMVRRALEFLGYEFRIVTEHDFCILSYNDVADLVCSARVVLDARKRMGSQYKRLLRQIELRMETT